MNDLAVFEGRVVFEVRVAFRARVLCRTAEPHHAAEGRPCQAHSDEARRQLNRPAVASSVPDSFRLGSRGIGADDGAAGPYAAARPAVPPSNKTTPLGGNPSGAEGAAVTAREGA